MHRQSKYTLVRVEATAVSLEFAEFDSDEYAASATSRAHEAGRTAAPPEREGRTPPEVFPSVSRVEPSFRPPPAPAAVAP